MEIGIVFRWIRFRKAAAHLRACLRGHSVFLIIPLSLDHFHQTAVSGPAKKRRSRFSFIHQDIVDGSMRVLRDCNQVSPLIDDVGSLSGRVEGFERLFAHHDLDALVFSRLDRLGLVETGQFHGRDFQTVLLRVGGIGFLQIELYDFFARPVSRVIDVDRDLIPFLAHFHLHVPELEICIRETVSERKRDFICIIEAFSAGGAQHRVLIPGLVIPVADIDPFGVSHIPGSVVFLAVPDRVVAEVSCCRRAETVIDICVRKSAGRIDFAAEHFRQRRYAFLSPGSRPQASINLIFTQEPHFHRILCVEHDDHPVKTVCDIREQVSLLFRQLQLLGACHLRFCRCLLFFRRRFYRCGTAQGGDAVRRFFRPRFFLFLCLCECRLIKILIGSASSDHDDRRFRILLKALLHFLGE